MSARSELEALTPGLRRYARGLTGRPEVADDLVQETLLSALRSTGIGRGAALRRRLYAILTDFNRMRAAMLPQPDAYGAAGRGEVVPFGRSETPSPPADPLAVLTLAEREALLLVVVEGFAYADAADIVGVSRVALIGRLARARGGPIEAEQARTGRVQRGHLRVVS